MADLVWGIDEPESSAVAAGASACTTYAEHGMFHGNSYFDTNGLLLQYSPYLRMVSREGNAVALSREALGHASVWYEGSQQS